MDVEASSASIVSVDMTTSATLPSNQFLQVLGIAGAVHFDL